MNFEEKIETQIEALRVFFYGFLKVLDSKKFYKKE